MNTESNKLYVKINLNKEEKKMKLYTQKSTGGNKDCDLLNYTEQDLQIWDRNLNKYIKIPASGKRAFMKGHYESLTWIGDCNGFTINVSYPVYDKLRLADNKTDILSEFPSQKDGVYLIVPDEVRTAYPDRTDLLSTGGKAVTNEKGEIIGYSMLVANTERTQKFSGRY